MRGAVTLETLKEVASGSSAEFYGRGAERFGPVFGGIGEVEYGVGGEVRQGAPPVSRIRGALLLYKEALETVAGEKAKPAPTPVAEPAATAPIANSSAPASAPPRREGGEVIVTSFGNREEAFQTLLKVAEYFRRTEPHTPISYTLEEAVRWGRMKLPDLLEELIGDEGTRQQVFKRVGIRPPPTTS